MLVKFDNNREAGKVKTIRTSNNKIILDIPTTNSIELVLEPCEVLINKDNKVYLIGVGNNN